MKCCANCFDDIELTGFIISNSTETGDCDFCGSKNTNLIDPREFEEKFLLLINVYVPVIESNLDGVEPALLHEKLQKEWGIFSEKINADETVDLLKNILGDIFDGDDALFDAPVERKVVLFDLDEADVLEKEWDKFVHEITSINRYFLGEQIDLKLLENLFRNHEKIYSKGKLFYRARISDKKGFELNEMGKPPAKNSVSGRANPVGIPYLYVSTNKDTVLYESRATHLDFITIAEFKLKERLNVVQLRQIENLSPFTHEDKLEDYLKYQKYIKRLEIELSKPLRRHDRKLEYLPTQYLCEYVKSLGYDAIEYGSSLHDGGVNLAIFNDDKLEGKNVEVHEVVSVELDTEVVNRELVN
ncbi:MAG: RES family NAD+ phosphorylase [Balneolaceae bacterium]|nr:RES family NAD+ phosphorylase [Balneolaceae bacterium]